VKQRWKKISLISFAAGYEYVSIIDEAALITNLRHQTRIA